MENLRANRHPEDPDTPKSKTAAATAGTNDTDEDAANEQFASDETSKGFDRDQEAIELGLNDGDLDTDLPRAEK